MDTFSTNTNIEKDSANQESQKVSLVQLEDLLSMVIGQHGALPLGWQQRLVDVGDHLNRDI